MRSQEEIEAQFEEAVAITAEGRSQYPGMTYEQGVRDAMAWVLEESDDAPMEVEE